ncbi:PREDICTED: E3 ubiquitin-protein ligase At4g11680-like isoform X2 [Nelumbo nucifera]|uniref:RING-type E3 ubiquitin transferase n=1 Tax=Nelumbo nucifera TaxID=4432 RepID=A0A1U7ZFV3_NELNU|nr:PREDICTED: E3 ubiquitin-protein ligase At4g11680-like isoform X2 [Nelumbo nucifera]
MEEEGPSVDREFDRSPLLQYPNRRNSRNSNENSSNSRFSVLISRATSRRIMREPSMFVRETAELQLEERQTDWGYSKPVVFLDVIWNLAFVLVSVVVLSSTIKERPSTPLRVWIGGYALQCLLHVGFVYLEYQRRNLAGHEGDVGVSESESQGSVAKRLESMNTMVSFFWWVIGFYWIVVGGQALLQDAPRLYWLAVVFLAFDVFFAIFCIALAFIVGIALCCCLPCIIAILYSMAVREGASEDDIKTLPRYRFRQVNKQETSVLDKKQEVAVAMEPSTSESIRELALPPEDSAKHDCLQLSSCGIPFPNWS